MRTSLLAAAVAVAALIQGADNAQPGEGRGQRQPALERLGWQIGVQTYSFKKFTLFEALEKAKAAGVKYAEAFPGQKVAKDIDDKMGPEMKPESMDKVKAKCKECDVTLVAFGVCGLGNEAEARKVFDFAKKMGIKVLTSEPPAEFLPKLDKLCEEYDLKVALHNHPKPSPYWDPDTVLKAVKDCGPRIGACADTGHWLRSGLVPIECMKKLEGRIVSMHLKDLCSKEQGQHDVVWGTGVTDIPAVMAEMLKQNFKGPISIEYEYNWDNSLPEITECVKYFTQKTREILRAQRGGERGQRGEARKEGGKAKEDAKK